MTSTSQLGHSRQNSEKHQRKYHIATADLGRHDRWDATALPGDHRQTPTIRARKRRTFFIWIILLGLAYWSVTWSINYFILGGRRIVTSPDDPEVMYTSRSQVPKYTEVYSMEKYLPQHDLTLPWPEGRHGRFLKFEWTYGNIGFNNQLQDILLTAQLAHLSNRAYAFQPYLWHRTSWTRVVVDEAGHLRSAEIPLNAFISGPAAGAPVIERNEKLHHPRAVTRKFFDKVCPSSRVTYLDVGEVRRKYGIEEHTQPSTLKMMDAWVTELAEMEDSCVVVRGDDFVWTFGAYGPRLTSMWPTVKDSPVYGQLNWSPLVQGIVANNLRLLAPKLVAAPDEASAAPSILPGTLAIHLRRGDFERHCVHLANMGSVFAGWANLPQLPDRLPDDTSSMTREERMSRCYPRVDQLIQKVRTVKREWDAAAGGTSGRSQLQRVYVLTNAEVEYRQSLTQLLKGDGWGDVVMSMDLEVRNEEKEVAVAADMMIAEIAEVFLGNGWSSLTSNVNVMRLVRGSAPESNRFL
ncbi:hypothetical protein FRB95_007836 [Tulasnella sp. JGI-2019a]|nr:hypothetical protein FRB95_007836 [Tulasnella sp. JGI-2019a]